MSLELRAKAFVARYGLAVTAAFVVVGLLALAGAGLTYTNPPTETVTETVDQQTVDSRTTTSAVVTGETPLYEQGARLRDRPVYFFNATPNMTLRVNTSVPAGQSVTVSHRLVLRHAATRDDEPFWQSRRVLAADRQNVSDGSLTTETTVNMSAVRRTVAERREEIGGVGTFESTVRLVVAYDTGTYTNELNASAPVTITDRAYWVDGALATNKTHSETTTREVTGSPAMGTVFGLGAAGVLALALGGASAWASRQDLDVDVVKTELTRSRYDEWISNGEIPTKAEKQYIRIDTLEDLVDIAIDSGKRVIYDDAYDAYGVVDGDVVYYYGTDDEFERWFDI